MQRDWNKGAVSQLIDMLKLSEKRTFNFALDKIQLFF